MKSLLLGDASVPEFVMNRIQTAVLPAGYGFLILIRAGHCDGESYDWRIFAIRKGRHLLHGTYLPVEGLEYKIGDTPIKHSFLDCNSDYDFRFPEGSMELAEGESVGWLSCQSAQYDY